MASNNWDAGKDINTVAAIGVTDNINSVSGFYCSGKKCVGSVVTAASSNPNVGFYADDIEAATLTFTKKAASSTINVLTFTKDLSAYMIGKWDKTNGLDVIFSKSGTAITAGTDLNDVVKGVNALVSIAVGSNGVYVLADNSTDTTNRTEYYYKYTSNNSLERVYNASYNNANYGNLKMTYIDGDNVVQIFSDDQKTVKAVSRNLSSESYLLSRATVLGMLLLALCLTLLA